MTKSIFLITLFLLIVMVCVGQAQEKRLVIGTASTGGTWYLLGGGVSGIINKYIKGVTSTAIPSGASIENIRAISKMKQDLALTMPDIAFYAFNGQEMFKDGKVDDIRGLFSTYPIDIQIYVEEKSSIKSISDIKGKNPKVAVGPPGSGTEVMARYVLKEYGITYDDIQEQFLSHTEATAAMKDGNIEVGIVTLGTPAPTLVELTRYKKIRFLDIEPAVGERVNKKFPAYFPRVIPSGTYPGMAKEHHTLGWMGFFIVNKDCTGDLAYEMLKAIFDHKAELDAIHAMFKEITLANATKGMSIPLHPGAVRFFKERGVIK
ncbi:MAG: TAXI family TRAP transporter solute-binding subunit [Deltaproteobacteria bacterium]|nr:TAXI family TRAP transporter solute-binding subunit [Deltaproteobacteria bacterium]